MNKYVFPIFAIMLANTSYAKGENNYHLVTDRVEPIANGIPIRRDGKESSPVIAFAAKGEQLRHYGTLMPGQWMLVSKLGTAGASGYVLSASIKIGDATDSVRRSLPDGVAELRTKTIGYLDSDAAVFYNGERVGDVDNYSGFGEMWVQGDHIILTATGQAGNSAEWCDLYGIQGKSAKYLGSSSCKSPISLNGALIWEMIQPNNDIEKITVKDGVYSKQIIPYARTNFSKVKDLKGGQDVTRWSKKYAFSLFEDIGERKRFIKIMGEKNFENLVDSFQQSSPCELSDGVLFCEGNKKMREQDAAIAISVKNGNAYAVLRAEGKDPRFFGGKVMPPAIDRWLLDKQIRDLPPHWSVSESKNPVDDRLQFWAFLKNPTSDRIVLSMRCKEGRVEMLASTESYIGSSDPLRVVYRIDKSPAVEGYWNGSASGKAAFYSGDAQAFLDALPRNGSLFIRVYDFRGVTYDADFKLDGIDAVRRRISSTCRKS